MDIIRLKSRGLITGGVNEVNFTKRGKIVITTMSLSEPNKFQTNATEKSYKEILASMDKKNKKGYRIPKFATNNSNNIRL
jgi:serine protease inhibitor